MVQGQGVLGFLLVSTDASAFFECSACLSMQQGRVSAGLQSRIVCWLGHEVCTDWRVDSCETVKRECTRTEQHPCSRRLFFLTCSDAQVQGFFQAQMRGEGIQGEAFMFEKESASMCTGFFRSAEEGRQNAKGRSVPPIVMTSARDNPVVLPPIDVGAFERAGIQAGRGDTVQGEEWSVSLPRGGGRKVPSFGSQKRNSSLFVYEKASDEEQPPEIGAAGGTSRVDVQHVGVDGGVSEEPLILVTAGSKDYFPQMQNLVGSVHAYEPDLQVSECFQRRPSVLACLSTFLGSADLAVLVEVAVICRLNWTALMCLSVHRSLPMRSCWDRTVLK